MWFPADETLIWITKCFDNFWSNTARWWKNFWRIDLPPDVAPYCFWYLSTKIQQLYFNNISNIQLHVLVLPFAASIIFMYCICIYLFLLSSFSKVGTLVYYPLYLVYDTQSYHMQWIWFSKLYLFYVLSCLQNSLVCCKSMTRCYVYNSVIKYSVN